MARFSMTAAAERGRTLCNNAGRAPKLAMMKDFREFSDVTPEPAWLPH
jgi:hypothetical protein